MSILNDAKQKQIHEALKTKGYIHMERRALWS